MTRGGPLVAGLVLVLASGCAPGTEQPSARTSGQEASPTATASASPSARASSSPSSNPSSSPATLEDSRCRVAGFVPSTRTVLRSRRRTSLYAAGLDLGPGVTARGPARLQRLGDVAPGVHVTAPAGTTVDAGILRRVGASVRRASPAPLPGEFFVRRRVRNRTSAPRLYAEYVAARVYRGTWTARACGGLVNDGTGVTTVRGSFTSIGLTDSGVIPCDAVTGERPAWVRRLATVCE